MQVGVIAAAITFMFLNFDALYRPVANFSLVPKAVRDSTYFLSPKLPLALRKSSRFNSQANA